MLLSPLESRTRAREPGLGGPIPSPGRPTARVALGRHTPEECTVLKLVNAGPEGALKASYASRRMSYLVTQVAGSWQLQAYATAPRSILWGGI